VEAFEYQTPAEVRDAAHSEVGACPPDNTYRGNQSVDLAELDSIPGGLDIPIYEVDSIVRRSAPLQQTHDARVEPADLSEVKSA
jgi:hypothetical protein